MVRVRLEGLPDEVQRIADAMQAAGCVRVYLDCDLPEEVEDDD